MKICTALAPDRKVVKFGFMWFTANLLMICLVCK